MNQPKAKESNSFMAAMMISGSMLVILFLAYAWGSSLVKYSSLDYDIRQFKNENNEIDKENQTLSARLKYLQSPQYRDKWAKQHEGLAQPGERVIVVEFGPELLEKEPETSQELIDREILLSQPNREQWRIFFFGER